MEVSTSYRIAVTSHRCSSGVGDIAVAKRARWSAAVEPSQLRHCIMLNRAGNVPPHRIVTNRRVHQLGHLNAYENFLYFGPHYAYLP